jgi:tricorn protease
VTVSLQPQHRRFRPGRIPIVRPLTGSRLCTVKLSGGLPEALPMVVSGAGTLSPDGERILFSPLFRDFRSWKRYDGGWAQDLLIFELDGSGSRNITDHVRTDRDPMWLQGGNT